MSKYNVEILDEYMYLQEDANDHQIRIVIEFYEKINIDNLRYAVKESFKYVPLLNCKLIRNGTHLYWEGIDCTVPEKQYFTVLESDFSFALLKKTLEKMVDQYVGPQISITVLRTQKGDILIITINHMVLDGSGFKNYLTLVSKIYNGIEINRNEISTERNIYRILKNKREKRKILQKHNILKTPKKLLEENSIKRNSMLFTQKINQSDYFEIQKFCKEKKVTINDYMMTVFFLALIDIGYIKLNMLSNISMMIDARKYDQDNILSPFINASSMEDVVIFFDSLDKEKLLLNIHCELEKIKHNMPGYKNLINLRFFRIVLPKYVYFKIMKNIIHSPGISTTNMGILNNEDFQFKGSKIMNAYIVTSLKRNNSIQFTFSTFENTVTITTFGNYSAENIERINAIYHNIGKHINIC